MSSVAVLSAQGLGDGLLMRIVCYHFEKAGFDVTLYHPQATILQSLFPNHSFASYPPLADFATFFQKYDLVFLENDHSAQAWTLMQLRKAQLLPSLKVIFPTPNPQFQTPADYVCDVSRPLASHLSLACQHFLPSTNLSKDNHLLLPETAIKHRYPNRIVLHPTSQDPKRNWKKKQFLSLASRLTSLGFSPIFTVSLQELSSWSSIQALGFSVIATNNLIELAILCYESGYFIGNDSGIGHLASNVGIPSLTLSGNPKRVALWRPGWAPNLIATPSIALPNFKGIGIRWRENYWQNFVSVSKVLKKFHELIQLGSQD